MNASWVTTLQSCDSDDSGTCQTCTQKWQERGETGLSLICFVYYVQVVMRPSKLPVSLLQEKAKVR